MGEGWRADLSENASREFSITYSSGRGLRDWFLAKWRRQPFFGSGEIEFAGAVIVLRGLQRTWLGASCTGEAVIQPHHIKGVWQEASSIEFVEKRAWRPARLLRFRARSDADAAAIVNLLPGIAATGVDVRDFQRKLDAAGRRAVVAPALVLANLLLYLLLIRATGLYGAFPAGTLLTWGGGVGINTANGQWWRLVSYAFLHMNLLHIGVNMWVLWSVGRLTEKLYGSTAFFLMYLFAAVTAGLFSMAWDPSRLTVGASGAIFGVLGALLAFLWHERARMPRAIFRSNWLPTIVFVLLSIASGVLQPGVDNAGHVSGLVAGLLLGFGLARPFDAGLNAWPDVKNAVALACAGAFAGLLFWFVSGINLTPVDRYLAARKWYADGETPNLMFWQQVANRAATGTISGADLSDEFKHRILPFWLMAGKRLKAESAGVPGEQRAFDALFRDFVDARRQWAEAVVAFGRSADRADEQNAINLMRKTDSAAAAIERLEMRSNMEHRGHALKNMAPFVTVRDIFWYGHRACVEGISGGMNRVSPTDAADDAPAMAHALGCRAQRLFLIRDFSGLESLIASHATKLDDLPDGGSSVEAIMGGLDNLFSYGGLSIDQMMERTAAWRRDYPRSLNPEFAEISALVAWAYSARGFGYANTISNVNLQLFVHRISMADSALRAISVRGAASPLWYEYALQIGLLQSGDKKALRAVFDRGISRFPGHMALYGSMLHILMPRWLGSFEEVGRFIAGQAWLTESGDRGPQLYAQLFARYAAMEGDNVNIFQDAGAKWDLIVWGLGGLIARYPKTDVYRNIVAKFSCEAQDWPEYRLFRKKYPAHYSASVWSETISIKSCDAKLAKAR